MARHSVVRQVVATAVFYSWGFAISVLWKKLARALAPVDRALGRITWAEFSASVTRDGSELDTE
jgi:hypothetical protein